MLRLCTPAVSRLSATIPRASSRRIAAPRAVTLVSRTDAVVGKAAEGLVKGCGRHGMQGSGVQSPQLHQALVAALGLEADSRPIGAGHRTIRKNARTSLMNSSGCSK